MTDILGPPRVELAGPFWRTVFRLTGFAGVTMPNRTIYLHPDYADNIHLLRHEHEHIRQLDNDGPWLWSFRIVWYLIRYGYHDSPYERMARAAETIDRPATREELLAEAERVR